MRWVLGIVLLLGGAGLGAAMLAQVVMQDDAIRHFVPVEAWVVSSGVRVHHGSKSTTYTPEVRYKYLARGGVHTSDQVTAFSESGDSSWARRIVKRYPAGAKTTAYVNPRDPAASILVREYSSTPYFLTCVGVWVMAFGAALLFVGPDRKSMRAVMLDPAGWQLLLPAKSMKRSRREAWLGFLATGVPTGLLLGHLVWVGRGLGASWIMIVLGVGVIVWEMVMVWRATARSMALSDPRVMVNPAPLRLGERFGIRAEFDAYRTLSVEKMGAQVVCVEHYRENRGGKTVYSTRTRDAADVELAAPEEVTRGQVYSGEAEVAAAGGEGWEASSVLKPRKYPYFTWEVRLDVVLAKRPDYHGVFPLEAVEGEKSVAGEE